MPVDCPKCSHPNTVPGKSRESKSATSASSGRPAAKVSRAFESKKFDQWIGRSEKEADDEGKDQDFVIRDEDSGSNVIESVEAGGSESASAVEEPWRQEPEGLPTPRASDLDEEDDDAAPSGPATIPLAVGAVVLLLVAFGIGILVGRYAFPATGGDKPVSAKPLKAAALEAPAAKIAGVPVGVARVSSEFEIAGKLEVQNDPARPAVPDIGATVIAFPANTTPPAEKKIPLAGLRPGDAANGPGRVALEAIGGRLATVDADGSFNIPLAAEGAFWVLVLSKNSPRSANTKLFQSEVETLGTYFEDVSSLLGKNDYLLVSRTAKSNGTSPIVHAFRYVP
jgi:hypothetical protein